MYTINFTERNKKFCLNLHYNKENSYLFVNGTKIINFKRKDIGILPHPLCLGNISKERSLDNMKKRDSIDMFVILVLIMMLLQLMIF